MAFITHFSSTEFFKNELKEKGLEEDEFLILPVSLCLEATPDSYSEGSCCFQTLDLTLTVHVLYDEVI